MLFASFDRSFIVQAIVINMIVITIVNYDRKTFIVQAMERWSTDGTLIALPQILD